MYDKSEILLVNVIHPAKGKLEDFVRIQTKDFSEFGSQLDGSISNEFFVSLNEGTDAHCVNLARFQDLESFYKGTSTETFKEHIKRIKPYLESVHPMLMQKVWQTGDTAVDALLSEPKFIHLRAEDEKLRAQLGSPKL